MSVNAPDLYVKKIDSLNPTQYKFLKLEHALYQYNEWIINLLNQKLDKHYLKDFAYWLKTEI